jgi:GNAT superfamily N-acetyltransferase
MYPVIVGGTVKPEAATSQDQDVVVEHEGADPDGRLRRKRRVRWPARAPLLARRAALSHTRGAEPTEATCQWSLSTPTCGGRGVGRQVLQGLHGRASERGWSRTKLWIRASNERARRLYPGEGNRTTAHESTVGEVDHITQLERYALPL